MWACGWLWRETIHHLESLVISQQLVKNNHPVDSKAHVSQLHPVSASPSLVPVITWIVHNVNISVNQMNKICIFFLSTPGTQPASQSSYIQSRKVPLSSLQPFTHTPTTQSNSALKLILVIIIIMIIIFANFL